ncbi:MAG: MFS transporter [Pseudomonadota bacterium]
MADPKHIRFEAAKWSIFSILILTYILVYFHRMAPGVVAEDLMAEFKTTGTRLGSLSAIYFLVYAVMQIPSGVLADTLGIRSSIVAGNITAGFGSICFGMASSFEMAYVGRFLVGLGVSVVFVSIMKSNSVWFHERVFGRMSGLTLLIGNLGSVIAAGPLSFVLTVFAWRLVFVGIGSLSLVLAVLGFLIVRNRPQDLGFAAPNHHFESPQGKSGQDSWFKNLASVVTTLRVWPGFWVQFGMIGGLYSFMGLWGIPFLKNVHGLDRSAAARHMTVMLLCFAMGALFFGWLSDKMGKRKPILLCCVLMYTLSWLVLVYVPWSPGTQGYLLFGFMGMAGSGFVLTFASAKEIIRPDLSGMAVSVVNTGCFIGTALMQPLFGWIADLSWNGMIRDGVRIYSATDFRHGFIAMIIFALIGLAGAFRVRETHCRNVTISR